MIFELLRIWVAEFIGLTLIYVLVSIYSRSVRREKLEKRWDTDPANEGATGAARDAFIQGGMDHYEHGLRRRLIWLVYVIPMVAVAVIVYFVNVQ
jgi:hypothetical protein